MSQLTTHVLDTACGKPADGLAIKLFKVTQEQSLLLKEVQTNSNGRTDHPLIEEGQLQLGTYEIQFDVVSYFSRFSIPQSDPPFLDLVTIRFTISDQSQHYHIPLLVSPWSYSTYRGS